MPVLFFFLWACSPHIIRYPGPLLGLGRDASVLHTKHHSPLSHDLPTSTLPSSSLEERIIEAAASFVGKTELRVDDKTFGYHCSGYVAAAFYKAGIEISGSTKNLFEEAKTKGFVSTNPQPGSLVFFDNTYDANKNGLFDDPLSHVGIVESVYPDGRVSLFHLGSKGIVSITMNLQQPTVHKADDGTLHNSYLRYRSSRDDAYPRLAGQLWHGFAFWEIP